jgi:predicted RNA-binding Zn ribbon-like protein
MALPDGPSSDLLVRAPAPTLCLAFANTLMWRGSPEPSESLPDVNALIAWCERQAFGSDALPAIRTWISSHPEQAAAWFAGAISLRETIYRVFESLAADMPIADKDFTVLSKALAAAPARAQLARQGNGYGWRIAEATPSAVLAPVLWSAADLLLDAGRRRIRQCANEKCLWLFVDESKSGTRRWCDMTSCGNRAKAQRHYARTKRA